MVPSAAGMAQVPYRTFFFWNVLGGTIWAVVCVVGGYFAGLVVGKVVSDVGLAVAVVAALLVLAHLWRTRRDRRRGDVTSVPPES
jgi:membrane-associated protein